MQIWQSFSCFFVLFNLLVLCELVQLAQVPEECADVATFDQLLGEGNQVRWLKVLSWSRISYNRGHSDQPKATVVGCDWNNCSACVETGDEIDIFPSAKLCHHFQVNKTYLVATNVEDDVTAPPIQVDPHQWSSFRQLCYFANSTLESKQCMPVNKLNCLGNDTTIADLLPDSSDCPQSSSSFKTRLSLSGAASVVQAISVGQQTLTALPCGIGQCSDLVSPTSEHPCDPTFGAILDSAFGKVFFNYPDGDCFRFNWQEVNSTYFLVFHEPYNQSMPDPNLIPTADPVEMTPEKWDTMSQLCYFTSNRSESCNATCLTDVALEPPEPPTSTVSPTTTGYPTVCDYGNDVCDSDCFSRRYHSAPEVFLGEMDASSSSGQIYCRLKTASCGDYNSFLVEQSNCPGNYPPSGMLHIFFAEQCTSVKATLVAPPIAVTSPAAWDTALSFCGISWPISFPTRQEPVTGLCCATKPENCSHDVSVASIESKNGPASTPLPVFPPYPEQQCSEEFCPFQVCDSECLRTRLDAAADVFWGDSLGDDNDGAYPTVSITVYCYLKRSRQKWASVALATNESLSESRCSRYPVPQTGTGPYLFFVEPIYPGNEDENLFKVAANHIRVVSLVAWTNITTLENITLELPANAILPPIGSCEKTPGRTITDLPVSKILEMNNVPCPEADNNLVIRFGLDGSSNRALVRADAVKEQDYSKLNKLCGFHLSNSGISGDLVVTRSYSTCFSAIELLSGPDIVVTLEPSVDSKFVPTSKALRTSDDGWTAITRLCSLWKYKTEGSACRNDSAGLGCFFSLQESEIDKDSGFNLAAKKLECQVINTDSFRERFDASSSAIFGDISAINYTDRSFSFVPECALKGTHDLENEITLKVTLKTDGCFSIDDSVIKPHLSFIMFADASDQLSMGEIAIADRSKLALFASACGTIADGEACAPAVDRKQGCYDNLSVEETLVNPPKLPELKLPTCCLQLQDNFTLDVFQEADVIVWATVDTMVTITMSNETTGDRLVGVSLVEQCYMKSEDGEKISPLTVLLNLGALVNPIHVGVDYVFILRRWNFTNPWKNLPYEIMATPIPASKLVWQKLGAVCGIVPSSSKTNNERCGSFSADPGTKCLPDLNLTSANTLCQANSDEFSLRIDSVVNGAAVIFGRVTANQKKMLADTSPTNSTLKEALPLHNPNREVQNVLFEPICQISGDIKPSTSSVYFSYYESDCFYDENFNLDPGSLYLVFIDSINGILTAAPIPIDERGIKLVAKSCAINPPPFSLFASPEAIHYEDICPTMRLSPKLCIRSLNVSEIRYQPEASSPVLADWAVALIVLACVAVVGGLLGIFIVRRRWNVPRAEPGPINRHHGSERAVSFSELPLTADEEPAPNGNDSELPEPSLGGSGPSSSITMLIEKDKSDTSRTKKAKSPKKKKKKNKEQASPPVPVSVPSSDTDILVDLAE